MSESHDDGAGAVPRDITVKTVRFADGIDGDADAACDTVEATSYAVVSSATRKASARRADDHGGVWGIDSMASMHVSGDRAQFNTLGACAPHRVTVADGGTVTVSQRGTVPLEARTAGGARRAADAGQRVLSQQLLGESAQLEHAAHQGMAATQRRQRLPCDDAGGRQDSIGDCRARVAYARRAMYSARVAWNMAWRA